MSALCGGESKLQTAARRGGAAPVLPQAACAAASTRSNKTLPGDAETVPIEDRGAGGVIEAKQKFESTALDEEMAKAIHDSTLNSKIIAAIRRKKQLTTSDAASNGALGRRVDLVCEPVPAAEQTRSLNLAPVTEQSQVPNPQIYRGNRDLGTSLVRLVCTNAS